MRGGFAPELLEAVVITRVGREDVDHDIEVVEQDPARLADALDPPRQQPVLRLQTLVDGVVDGPGLTIGAPGADHEVVGIADHAPQVELDDVQRLAVRGELGDLGGHLLGAHDGLGRLGGATAGTGGAHTALRVEPVLGDVVRDGVGDQVADRLTGTDATAHHRRGDTDARHREETRPFAAGQRLERGVDR